MNNITLQRTITVKCWHVVGTIARVAKRPELLSVLTRARDQEHTTAEDIAAHLLFEQRSRRVVAERLLRIAESYGLLTREKDKFTLTETGTAALATQHVFIPEHGSWKIWSSDDPLLGSSILRVEERAEPGAHDEAVGKEKPRVFKTLPRELKASEGKAMTTPSGGERRRIEKLEENVEECPANSQLTLVWKVSERSMRLEGTLAQTRLNAMVDVPNVTEESVWKQLLESAGLTRDWNDAKRALLVGVFEANESERESMRRNLTIKAPRVGELGLFAQTTINDVPIHARTTDDAKVWAALRLQARLSEYATRSLFEKWAQEAVAPFPGISVPSRAELAEQVWAERARFPSIAWHLNAAEDWSL